VFIPVPEAFVLTNFTEHQITKRIVMNRRQFLKLGASGTAVLFAWTPMFAGPAAVPANLDPRVQDGFSNPLLTPGGRGSSASHQIVLL